MSKTIVDCGVVLTELAEGMTVPELQEWRAAMPDIAERQGLDINGTGAVIVREVIDTAIASKCALLGSEGVKRDG